MANPQLENGYTRIANEILDALANIKLNGTQFRIVLAVIRCTYGFQKKEHEMSLDFISEATGIDKRNVRRELSKLIEDNILVVIKEQTYTTPRIIAFNKNYKEWGSINPQRADSPTEDELTPSLTNNREGESTLSIIEHETNCNPCKITDSIGADRGSINPQRVNLPTEGEFTPQKRNISTTTSTTTIETEGESTPTIKSLGDVARKVSELYGTLTGKPAYMGQEVIIFNFLKEIKEENRDLEIIKEAMIRAKSNWTPKFKDDQIRSFKYFIPAIKEMIAFKEAKENASSKGHIDNRPNQNQQRKFVEPKPNTGFRKFKLKTD